MTHGADPISTPAPAGGVVRSDPTDVLLESRSATIARGKRDVVHAASCVLRKGEIVALLGPNGAGKSTLLDGLAGALELRSGEILRHGRVAIALQAADLARRSVLTNVKLALSWWGVPRDQRASRAQEALRLVSAEHLASRDALTLSGGERRRVHLARVLAVQPGILLLDEPFAGLDAETRGGLLQDSVSALRSENRATLVVVHDRSEAWALADRLLVMIDGRIVAAGPLRDVLERPPTANVARFLGYDGELQEGERVRLTRPSHVQLTDDGELIATVRRTIPLEDGARVELETAHGRLVALSSLPVPAVGVRVRVRLAGGAFFPPDGLTT